MTFLCGILTLFYLYILFRLLIGFHKLEEGGNPNVFPISIIIAARNEEKNIRRCIDALISQSYPNDKLEIIIVDDRSTDGTATIINKYREIHQNIKLLQIKKTPPGIAPKKHAIDQGIQKAGGEVLFFTDADCIPGPGWIKSMVRYFDPDVGLVAGFSPLNRAEKETIFTKLVCLDSLSLAAVAAGSFGAGFPLTCNARNLAYRKAVYNEVGGFSEISHLVSGDDDLFLHLVNKKTTWSVRYAIDKATIVSSSAPTNFEQFKNQRIRHASKGRHYAIGLKSGLTAVYLLNLTLFVLFFLSFMEIKFLIIFTISYILKTTFEFILIKKAAITFSCAHYLKYFPLAAILHIPYVTIFGLWGQLGKFKWKDDTFQASLSNVNK